MKRSARRWCATRRRVIAMNLPSLDKYEPLVKPGGVLVVNTSMVNRRSHAQDIKVIVRCRPTRLPRSIGDKRMTNMVLLGGLLANLPVLPLEALERAISEHSPAATSVLCRSTCARSVKGPPCW